MDIKRIKEFCLVVETNHIRKAAEILAVTSPALSKSMRVLEKEAGRKLIIAKGRGIEITPEGRDFYHKAQGLLSEFGLFTKTIAEVGESNHVFRIGSYDFFSIHLIAKFLNDNATTKTATVFELNPGKIEQALLERKIDVGITANPSAVSALEFIPVTKYQNLLVGKRRAVEKKAFSDWPFAIPVSSAVEMNLGMKSADAWPADKFPRKIKFEFQTMEVALQTAAKGLCVVYVPDFVFESFNKSRSAMHQLDILPLPKKIKREMVQIYLVKRKNESESKDFRELAKWIRHEI